MRLRRFLPSAHSVAAGIALLALALGGYAAARTTAVFAIREVQVEGATPALAQEIREALRPFGGESLLAIDPAALVGGLEAIPHVRAAGYDRSFPHTLVVTVEREVPAAVVRRGADSWLVSERGRLLERVPRGAHPRLPRVWVPQTVAAVPGLVLASPEAVKAVRAAAILAESPLPVHVRTVRAGERELAFGLASGLELRLGDERDLDLKLAVAARILPALPVPAAGGPQYLDVGVPERAVAGRNPQVEG